MLIIHDLSHLSHVYVKARRVQQDFVIVDISKALCFFFSLLFFVSGCFEMLISFFLSLFLVFSFCDALA